MADILSTTESSLTTCKEAGSPCLYHQEITQLREQLVDLTAKAHTDVLTGLHNFRFFKDVLPLEMERTRRTGQPLTIILLDVDHFKAFNDRWGHESGNLALSHIAALIADTLRKLDIACRYGGEEFVIILPDTSLLMALRVAERLRKVIETSPLMLGDNPVPLTASLGIDEYRFFSNETPESLLARVDQWLYQAKQRGRNQLAFPDPVSVVTLVSAEEKHALFFNDDTRD